MRRFLDGLYLWSGYLSGLFLAMIAITIIAQVVGRLVGLTIDSTETAGFSLAASTFLGLAYALRTGGHIRVTLAIRHASPGFRRWIEAWCLAVSIAGVSYFLWWSADLVYFSWKFNEISPGLAAIPFWIPRLSMALGSAVLLIALLDDLICLWSVDLPSYEANTDTVQPVDEATP